MNPIITTFDSRLHRDQVISLWEVVFGYEADHSAPQLVIDKKLEFGDGLFFIALNNQTVVGTIMAGYDGHRGWIYSIAVSPNHQKLYYSSGTAHHRCYLTKIGEKIEI